MKKIRFILVFIALLLSFGNLQAQIWKQIQDVAQKKVNQKVQKQIDTSFANNQANQGQLFGLGANKIDASVVPVSYVFNWKYSMEINSDQGKSMIVDYYLEPNAFYFGFKMGQGEGQNMFLIMDAKNKLIVTCFENGKEKMASASKMPDYSEMAQKEGDKTKFTYKNLPNKTFLGYNCKGIQATNEEFDIVFYFTNDAKVSFADLFKNQKNQKMPDAFTKYFKPEDKPLMMDMTMTDLKNKGKVTTMKCVSLEKSAYTFLKSEYKFM